MNLTPQQISAEYYLAFSQYISVDNDKVERYGQMIQGLMFIKLGEQASVLQFNFCNPDDMKKAVEAMCSYVCDTVSFSFVQHYIHYCPSTKLKELFNDDKRTLKQNTRRNRKGKRRAN